MAYRPHWLFTFGGSLAGSGVEIWQCGVRGTYTAFSGNEDAFLADVAAPMVAWFQKDSSQMRSDAALNWIKLNKIGPDGKYVTPNATHTRILTPALGHQNPLIPEFTDIAISWRTDSVTKYALNGRIYPPNSITANPGQTRISTADRQAILNSGVELVLLLRNGDDETAGGVFRATVESKHAGEFSPITRVRCGDVIDVQRRRKNQIREQYATAAVPPP